MQPTQASASQLDGPELRCAKAYDLYCFVEPTVEIVPCQGSTKEGGTLVKSI